MNDKFDKILTNKIIESLENREVEYNPEHWQMLLTRQEHKKRRILFLWRFAGIVLILVMAGIISKILIPSSDLYQNNEIQLVGEEPKNKELEKRDDLDIDNSEIENFENDVEESVAKEENVDSNILNNPSSIQGIRNSDKGQIAISNKKDEEDIENKKESTLVFSKTEQNDSLKVNTRNSKIGDIKNNDNNIVQNEAKKSKVEPSKPTNRVENKKNIEELMAVNDDKSIKKEIKKPVKIGLNVSPMINMIAENSNSNIGFSSGVSVEIPILKKFDVFTGILYTNQKFDIQNELLSSSESLDNVGIQQTSLEATVNGIEIPLNIKYNFAISKKNVFVSAGFSSTSYFKESTKIDYIRNTTIENTFQDSAGNNIIQYRVEQSSETIISKENPDEGFDFASMLNFSFGMEFPVNKKRQSLVIEPYFKYSLNTITIKEFDYSSAGFYLRYNFSLK